MKTEQLITFLISPEQTIVEAMQKIDANAKGILFITNTDRKLIGAITDGDIRRWLIKTGNLQEQISRLMNRNPDNPAHGNNEGARNNGSGCRMHSPVRSYDVRFRTYARNSM